jgi:hypothetical protein
MIVIDKPLYEVFDLPVVPVRIVETEEGRKRQPLVEWGRWIDGRQTPEERGKILSWAEREGLDVAIVGGHNVEGYGYFCCIDIDLPSEEALSKLRGDRRIVTYLERSRRGRLHAYYFSRRPVPTLIFEGVPIELLGRGHLITVAPSKGYKPLNSGPLRVVDDALKLFIDLAVELGYDLEEALAQRSGETETDQPVLNGWLEAIVEELRRRGLNPRKGPNYYSCLCPFHKEAHPSFAINHRRYYGIDYHDGKVYRLLDLAKKLGLELIAEVGEDSSAPKINTVPVVGGEVIGDVLVEVVAGPKLLLYYPAENKIVVAEELRQGDKVYRPYHTFPYPLADVPKAIGPDPTLWVDTREFIRAYFDHLDPRVYDIMTAAVAWSYFYRDIGVSTPYILFLGPWRSGKTRALEVLESLSYKAVRVVDPSEASLFRSIELLRPTLLIDESQIVDQNVRAVMASGYRYGSKVMRVIDPEAEGFEGMKFFDTFAFIIYASREEPPSDILSRTVVVHCEKNLRPTLKRIDEARALDLRTRWLAQKLYYHGKIEVTFEEFESADGRLQELFSPLIVMAKTFGGDEAAKAVESYGRTVEMELNAYEASTPEAELVEAVARIVEERAGDVPEVVYNDEIVAALNSHDWTPERVGRRMAALGFKRYRGPNGRRGYIVDLALLRRLKLRYSLFQETLPTAQDL